MIQGLSVDDSVPPGSRGSFLGKTFFPTSNQSDLNPCDIFVICVPTPLGVHNEPDLNAVCEAARLVAGHLRKGALAIRGSTTYPATTGSVLVPILEGPGMTSGLAYHVAYA